MKTDKQRFDRASEVEKNLRRDRMLMVKALMSEMTPYERVEVIRLIEQYSTKVTDHQMDALVDLVEDNDFKTIV